MQFWRKYERILYWSDEDNKLYKLWKNKHKEIENKQNLNVPIGKSLI